MSSKVLEVSTYNAEYVESNTNAEFLTVFNPPLNLKEKSLIEVNKVFLDIKGSGIQGNTFYFNEDVELTFTVGYYEQNNTFNYKNQIGSIPSAPEKDHEYYILGYFIGTGSGERLFRVYTRDVNITIPAGSYSPTGLAKKITDLTSKYNNNNTIIRSERNPENTENGFYYNWELYVDEIAKLATETGQTLTPAFVGVDEPNNSFVVNWNNGSRIYDYNTSPPTKAFLGTSDVEISYDNDLFKFEFLHNSILIKETSPVIRLKKYPRNLLRYIWLLVRGGVFINDLQPRSFWEDLLKFDVDKIRAPIFAIDKGGGTFSESIKLSGDSSFLSATTRPFVGLASIDAYTHSNDDMFSVTFDFDDNTIQSDSQWINVTTTEAITSQTPANDNLTGGYYLLEVTAIFNNSNYKDSKQERKISGILSRQYINDGYLTAFADSSINSLMEEESLLTSIKIRILDPETKELTEDLGNNNVVFFQVFEPEEEEN